MDDATAEIVQQWLRKAANDLQNIRNNLCADEVPTDTICFHAQQAVEKLLKSVLVANGRPITKTHDLVRLLSDATDLIPELLPFEEQFEEVSEYGVAVRYPNGFSEPTLSEAARVYEIAREVERIVRLKISAYKLNLL
jgi:HEPN domain-containing protein